MIWLLLTVAPILFVVALVRVAGRETQREESDAHRVRLSKDG